MHIDIVGEGFPLPRDGVPTSPANKNMYVHKQKHNWLFLSLYPQRFFNP